MLDGEIKNGVTDEITVEQLSEDVNMLLWERGIECFEIVEDLDNCNKRYYIVRGLSVEYDDKTVYCEDIDNIICKNTYVLMGFLQKHIINISRTITDTERYGEIYLDFGMLTIRVLDY